MRSKSNLHAKMCALAKLTSIEAASATPKLKQEPKKANPFCLIAMAQQCLAVAPLAMK